MQSIEEIIANAPDNIEIVNSWLVTEEKLGHCQKAMCSVSGGSDSDIITDLCAALDKDGKVTYVFLDTGLEFQATKAQLKYLEERYGIEVMVVKAKKPIPVCCREYGVPFLSKHVSEMIQRLQRHSFQWEDRPFEELYAEYPHCKIALKWWCNAHDQGSRFNIRCNTWLKEFMVANPPDFRISNKCCYYAKKMSAKQLIKEGGFDLSITGMRKAEGGVRATAYKNCFSPATSTTIAQYRPLFWFRQDTKRQYEEHYNIKHSACYELWGLKRTGCSGCPFAKHFESELAATEKYEPKLYKALNKVFGASYEYTRKYRLFQQNMKKQQKAEQNCHAVHLPGKGEE